METLKAIILGIVQGITEFFPVSSSGHLVLIPFLFKWDYIPVYYTVMLHFATLLALITVFYRDAWRIIRAFFLGLFKKDERSKPYFKTSLFIIIATIPAVFAGIFLEGYVNDLFSSPLLVGVFLLITASILILGEKLGGNLEDKNTDDFTSGQKKSYPKKIGYMSSFITGLGQAIAIIPGISRSGSTISFARAFGIKREEAVRFSLLLSIPVISGAFVFEMIKSSDTILGQTPVTILNMFAGFIFAYISGYFSIRFLVKISKNRNLNFFAIYCIVIAIIVFILFGIRKI